MGAAEALGSQPGKPPLIPLPVFHSPGLLQLLAPSCSWDSEGLHCSCSSRAWPAPSLHWRLGEGLLEGNSSNASFKVTSSSLGPWVNSSLSLLQELRPSLWLSCEAWNTHGAQTTSVLLLPGKDPLGLRFTVEELSRVGRRALWLVQSLGE